MSNCETFKVLTFNCNGINNLFLRKQKSSIIFLKETHLKFEAERSIRSGWGFECFLSGAETNKTGVAVLIYGRNKEFVCEFIQSTGNYRS